jgi:Fe-S cluster biogenesis protein NfuA
MRLERRLEVMEIAERIERALDMCRPYLRVDGGDVKFVRFEPESGRVLLQWEGTCRICPISVLTLRAGVERAVMKAVPEVKRVEAISG